MPIYDTEHRSLKDSYLSRVRAFQDQLITWGVTWNLALIGTALIKHENTPNNSNTLFNLDMSLTALGTAFFLNCILAVLYSNGKVDSNKLAKDLPKIQGKYLKNIYILSFTWFILQSAIIFLYWTFLKNEVPQFLWLLDTLRDYFTQVSICILVILFLSLIFRHFWNKIITILSTLYQNFSRWWKS